MIDAQLRDKKQSEVGQKNPFFGPCFFAVILKVDLQIDIKSYEM